MSHPYAKHSENAVGHRRASKLTTGKEYASGGSAGDGGTKTRKYAEGGEVASAKPEGKMAGGRLDKRARGGKVQKFQLGGPIHKMTPKKHKPHTNINITNISAPRGGAGIRPLGGAPPPNVMPPGGPPLGGAPPPGLPPMGMKPPGMGGMKRGGKVQKRAIGGPTLPAQANPRAVAALAARPVSPAGPTGPTNPNALAALAARPALPTQAQGVRPFKKGGIAKRASGGRMRVGKKYGQGSGEGRLEEFKHMK